MDYKQAVAEFSGNDAIVIKTTQQFISQVKLQLVTMRAAVIDTDGEIIAREAHRIRGGAANLTAMTLSDVATKLEDSAISGEFDLAGTLINCLANETENLDEFLARIEGENCA